MGLRRTGICIMAFLICFVCFCCQNKQKEQSKQKQINVEKEKIAVNQEIVRKDNANIELIAKRYNWNLAQSESGLCYQIIPSGKGDKAQSKDIVTIKGRISLPEGKDIYNSVNDETKEFRVDRSEDAVGLHELVKLMRAGDKARAIIPSYLAYGISGDGEQIPPIALLICEIELIKIN